MLCASLDDIAQSTEWGRDGIWASRPLVAGFREGVRGYEGIQSGVGFFRLLDESKRKPGTEMALLELMYLCLSLGFLGEFRVDARPMASLDRIRQDLYAIIANHRRPADPALSPHWQGQAAPYKPPGAVVPILGHGRCCPGADRRRIRLGLVRREFGLGRRLRTHAVSPAGADAADRPNPACQAAAPATPRPRPLTRSTSS